MAGVKWDWFLQKIKIVLGEARTLYHFPRLSAYSHQGKAGRQHESLLGAGYYDIHTPSIHREIYHPQARNRIDYQEGWGLSDNLGNGLDVVKNTRRGFAMGTEDDRDLGILLEGSSDECRVNVMP
jgi:hypothetical protein